MPSCNAFGHRGSQFTLPLDMIRSMRQVTGRAFISYAREDSERVDQLQGWLEAAGVQVWRDTAHLWPGEDWRARTRRAITDDALVFIACFSHASVGRDTSYQNEELAIAIDYLRRRHPDDTWLIPVRFDDCDMPDPDIGSGRTLKSIYGADLFGDRFGENAARLVVAAVSRVLAAQKPGSLQRSPCRGSRQ